MSVNAPKAEIPTIDVTLVTIGVIGTTQSTDYLGTYATAAEIQAPNY